eukprot:4233846-Pleurochrysis_carterae.AAC.1
MPCALECEHEPGSSGECSAPPGHCHLRVIADAVAQHLAQRRAARQRPPDQVDVPPRPARGLGLEAAKPHKWHAGTAAVWIGVGLC